MRGLEIRFAAVVPIVARQLSRLYTEANPPNLLYPWGLFVGLIQSSVSPIQNGNSSLSSGASCHSGYLVERLANFAAASLGNPRPDASLYLASRSQISRSDALAICIGSASSRNMPGVGPSRIR